MKNMTEGAAVSGDDEIKLQESWIRPQPRQNKKNPEYTLAAAES